MTFPRSGPARWLRLSCSVYVWLEMTSKWPDFLSLVHSRSVFGDLSIPSAALSFQNAFAEPSNISLRRSSQTFLVARGGMMAITKIPRSRPSHSRQLLHPAPSASCNNVGHGVLKSLPSHLPRDTRHQVKCQRHSHGLQGVICSWYAHPLNR